MIMSLRLKEVFRAFAPPVLYQAASHWKRFRTEGGRDLEYVPAGWQEPASYRGWNAEGVLEAYRATWPRLVKEAQTPDPFNLVMGSSDAALHNILLCFAYSLTLAAQGRSSLSMLDWGGAIGQYKILAQAALPGRKIDYHCKDVPLLAEYGQHLNPDSHFSSDDSCLNRSYDFVLASGSLQYSEDWRAVFRGLAQATSGYFLLTRTPTNRIGPSYVFVQRAYDTEYQGWSLSYSELQDCASSAGLTLVREFMMSNETIPILGVPHPSQQRGFLFRSGGTA